MEEMKETLQYTINTKHILNTLCVAFDENDERKITENTFFKLFVYNENVNDLVNTDTYLHFRDILLNKGISVEDLCEPGKLEQDTRDEMMKLVKI